MANSITSVLPQDEHARIELTISADNTAFSLYKYSSADNFTSETIISIFASGTETRYYYDYVVEPGVFYKYKIGSSGALTNAYMVGSTGSFLLGQNNTQLNFIYNSSISDFKKTKKDSIIETIGSQYPYLIRSSNIGYKQLSFSGAIVADTDTALSLSGGTYSTLITSSSVSTVATTTTGQPTIVVQDISGILIGSTVTGSGIPSNTIVTQVNSSTKTITLDKNATLTGTATLSFVFSSSSLDSLYLNGYKNIYNPDKNQNFVLEKFFRKNVLNWLNDGAVKVFKSDTEDMILGRVTDVSLSPMEGTSRIIYNVSFTFTEINSIDKAKDYGLYKTSLESSRLTNTFESNSF